MRRFIRLTGALLALLLVFSVLSGCGGAAPDVPSCTAAPAADAVPAADAPSDTEADAVSPGEPDKSSPAALDEGGEYTSAEDVALYLHLYAHLPQNFITKKMPARSAGTAAGWTITPTANASAATGSETTKDFCRTRPGGSTMSAISTHCTPSRAGRSASYTPMTGLSIIPRITTRALYCFMAKNDVLLNHSFYILSISFPLLCAIILFGF